MSNAATTDETVLDRVISLLGKQTASDPTGWSAATRLDETGLDSFDFIEYMFLLEDEFKIEVKYNHNDIAKRFATIGDVADAISGILDGKAAEAVPAGAAGMPVSA